MRKLIFIFLFAACNTATPSLESKVKDYMKDSVVSKLDDPKSYEWASMTVDTVMRRKFSMEKVEKATNDLKTYQLKLKIQQANTNSDISNGSSNGLIEADRNIEKSLSQLISIDSEIISTHSKFITSPDTLLYHEINVKFRAKNKMGALILDNLKLRLEGDKFSIIQ